MVPENASQAAALIQMTLVPVIMISAVGLICLVVQNRHGLVVERVFRLNRDRLRLLDELRGTTDDARAAHLRTRLDEAGTLTRLWLRRGAYTRTALALAFLGILLFALTSLGLVIAAVFGVTSPLSLLGILLFVGGILAFIASFGFVLADLQQSLTLSRLDTQHTDRHVAESGGSQPRVGLRR